MRVRPKKPTERKQEDYFSNLVSEGVKPPTEVMHGITKEDIRDALKLINRDSVDLVDVVFSLLDDQFPNLFNSSLKFSDGASTAHIGCYVGIYLRHAKKLDREGRDYWIKPLREVGVIEAVTYTRDSGDFVCGHLTAKSPSSAYRIDPNFVQVLKSKKKTSYTDYFNPNQVANRLMLQSKAVAYVASQQGHGDHHKLIELTQKFYIPTFLSDFKVCYIDNSDGDRISPEERKALQDAGIDLTLHDVFPDIILAADDGRLWFVEAVTSDGEVDETKIANLTKFCTKHSKTLAGATTCYLSWKALAGRQDRFKNLAIGTYVWIANDPSKHLLVKAA